MHPPSGRCGRRARRAILRTSIRIQVDANRNLHSHFIGGVSSAMVGGFDEWSPQQARSRATLARLLDAAEAVLAREGLEAATVPAIAERAGASVGAVYRRFPDKDALLRAVCERFLERIDAVNAMALEPELCGGLPAAALARRTVQGLVSGYRIRAGMLRPAPVRGAASRPRVPQAGRGAE